MKKIYLSIIAIVYSDLTLHAQRSEFSLSNNLSYKTEQKNEEKQFFVAALPSNIVYRDRWLVNRKYSSLSMILPKKENVYLDLRLPKPQKRTLSAFFRWLGSLYLY